MRFFQTYADFDVKINIALPYATTHAARLIIGEVQIMALAAATTKWTTEFNICLDPLRHTSIQVEATRMAYDAVSDLLAGLQQQLKNNHAVELTAADYENLDIYRNAPHRRHRPVPKIAPNCTLLETRRLTNKISVHDPEPGMENHRRLPPDVARVARKIALVAQGAPAPIAADYHSIDSIGSGTFTLVWQPEQVGMRCFIIVQYMNYRGETGPESVPLKFVVI